MKQVLTVLFMLTFGAVFGFAESLDSSTATSTAIKVLDLIFLGAKVVGAIVIVLGIVELLVEKDQGGQQGKKVTGAMKLGGGVLLLLAASVIGWLIGENDVNNGTTLIKKVSA